MRVGAGGGIVWGWEGALGNGLPDIYRIHALAYGGSLNRWVGYG
jgi:hypothetical protein